MTTTATVHWLMDLIEGIGAAWWTFTTAVIVPISAAGIAAYVVVLQIRRTDGHRVEDRRGRGVKAGCEMFSDISLRARSNPKDTDRLSTQPGRRNLLMVDLYSNLSGPDVPVAEWCITVNTRLADEYRQIRTGERVFGSDSDRRTGYLKRRELLELEAAVCVSTLLQWQRSEIPTSWFASQVSLRRTDTAPNQVRP
jgi:hypothetical protein